MRRMSVSFSKLYCCKGYQKVVSISVSVLLCLSLTACWDSTEVKDLALVMATGIDKADKGRVRVTVQVAIPSTVAGGQVGKKGGREKAFIVESAVGLDKRDAVQKIQEKLSREFYTSHQQVIVIGEEAAKSGVENILDTFSRDPRNRWRTIILIARNSTAQETLQAKTILEPLSADEAKKLDMTSIGSETTLMKFLNDIAEPGVAPIAGAIEKSSSGDEPIRIGSAAVFHRSKLIGYLDDEEARGLLWVGGKISHAYVTAMGFPHQGAVTMYVTSTHSKIQHRVAGKTIHFDITLTGKGEVVENTAKVNFHRKQGLDLVNKRLNNSVSSYVRRCIEKSQTQLHADVMGLGEEIYRDDPKLWQSVGPNWSENYPHVQVHVHVHLQTLRPGTTGGPIQSVE